MLRPAAPALLLSVSLSGAILARGAIAHGEAIDAGVEAGVPSATTSVVADGEYQLLEPAATDEAMRAAVQAVLVGLHPAMRDPFRAQLGTTLRAPRRFTLSHRGDDAVTQLDGHELAAPLGGAERRQNGPEGRPVRVLHRLEGAVFVQEIRTGQFTLLRRFVVDGGGVRVDSELRSGMLPRPVTTTARYASVASE